MTNIKTSGVASAVALALSLTGAHAIAADPSKLQNELTPLGGERAGNADGTIPAWTGKQDQISSNYVGDIPAAVYEGEKPLYSVTASNMQEYADKLTPGTQALLKKYSDTFRLDVYPTHRSAIASELVYQRTADNAKNCKHSDTGAALSGCIGGVPFPMPEKGEEIVWNFLMHVEADTVEYGFRNYVVSADGSRSLATQNNNYMTYPYYYEEATVDGWDGRYFLQRFDTRAPSFKVGESLVIHDSINSAKPRQAWQYLVGQRRVRRAPTVAYDTPDFVASGANYFDEVEGFFGSPDRFDWKIVGKKEVLVPYNNNRLVTASVDEGLAERHFNPDIMRWELHRVWEVEATVSEGKRHAVPKRRFFFDEDSWVLLLMDGYDAEGNLWRTSQVPPFVLPKVPAKMIKPAIVFNLEANTTSFLQLLNSEEFYVVERKDEEFYTGQAVAADSIR